MHPKEAHHTPQGYPCCNPTFDAAVRGALKDDAKKIAEGERYLCESLKQLRKAKGEAR